MTVSTTHIENNFVGDGSTTVFNFTFQVQSAAHVQVRRGGVLQTPPGFTVSINQNQETSPGGKVTFTVAPTNGQTVSAKRATVLTQDVDFPLESKLNTKNVEKVLDKLTMLLQEASANTKGEKGDQGVPGIQGPPGEVDGPASSTNNALAVWNGTGGNTLKNGPAPINNGDTIVASGGQWIATAAAGSNIPSGAQILWDTDLAAIPTGWEPCDGRTVTINGVSKVTKDTRGKYLLAAAIDDTGSIGYTGATVRPGVVGGTKTHNHSFSVGFTTANSSPGSNVSVNNGSSILIGVKSNAALTHNHTGTVAGNTSASSEAARPLGISVLVIVKVDE